MKKYIIRKIKTPKFPFNSFNLKNKFKLIIKDVIYYDKYNIFAKIPTTILKTIELYQVKGVEFMLKALNSGLKGCIQADDMGLGKTLQTLVVILYYINNNMIKEGEKILIIVPKSVVSVWQTHFSIFAPETSLYFFQGEEKEFLSTKAKVILTTYDTIRKMDVFLKKHHFYLLILDEAHKIKNYKTTISIIIKALKSKKKLALTGTPMENKFNDFINLSNFIGETKLNNFKNELLDDTIIHKIRSRIIHYTIRREKAKILHLPKITEEVFYCSLNKTQETLLKKADLASVNTTYRKYCKKYGIGDFNKAWQIIRHPKAITKIFEPTNFNLSGKMSIIIKIIKNIPANEKLVLFSPSTRVIRLFELKLKQLGYGILTLTGNDTVEQRTNNVDKFEKDPIIKVFLISTKAGGTGLTLIKANHVIHHDHWWTHSSTNQATARVYRKGQTKPVTVYKIITKNTFEQSMHTYADNCYKLFVKIFNNLDNTKYNTRKRPYIPKKPFKKIYKLTNKKMFILPKKRNVFYTMNQKYNMYNIQSPFVRTQFFLKFWKNIGNSSDKYNYLFKCKINKVLQIHSTFNENYDNTKKKLKILKKQIEPNLIKKIRISSKKIKLLLWIKKIIYKIMLSFYDESFKWYNNTKFSDKNTEHNFICNVQNYFVYIYRKDYNKIKTLFSTFDSVKTRNTFIALNCVINTLKNDIKLLEAQIPEKLTNMITAENNKLNFYNESRKIIYAFLMKNKLI